MAEKFEYEIIDIDEQPTHVGVTVRYTIGNKSGRTDFSFNPESFYENEDKWKEIIDRNFNEMKKVYNSEKKANFNKNNYIGQKKVVL